MSERMFIEAEIAHLEAQIDRLKRDELDSELFKKVRLQYGIYSMRRASTSYMVRVKVPLGIITPEQLQALGDVCEVFTPGHAAHLTTRQAIQLYGVAQAQVLDLLRTLARIGLTTREASGNVVRNVTCCPFAGVAPEEPFDITPYAQAVSDYFLRNALTQILPRKIKIAFEGCRTDHARIPIHDIGVVAALQDGREGFRIYVGGGLGPVPKAAQLLEPWTSAEWLLPTVEAVLRMFERVGERQNRAVARLKFLIERLGWPEFQRMVLEARPVIWATQSGHALRAHKVRRSEPSAAKTFTPRPASDPAAFGQWQATNVMSQKQPDAVSVAVRVPCGDITATQLRGLAAIAQHYAGHVRLTNTQNLLLRGIARSAVPDLYEALQRLGVVEAGAWRLADITRCPGADTCLSAITRPRGLAQALERMCHNGLSRWADAPLSIKISGCPNSCGHHHIADLGFFGVALKSGEQHLPCYQILVGGRTTEGQAVFGKRLLRVPARRAPEAVKRLMQLYEQQRQADEPFAAFVDRIGLEILQRALADLADVSSAATQPELFVDLGETDPFVLEAGKGECAA